MIPPTWPAAFAATLALELPAAVLAAPAPLRKRTALDGALANLLTHPLAWWLVTGGHAGWWAVECGVVVVEAAVYAGITRMGPWRALGVALLANGISAGLGVLLL